MELSWTASRDTKSTHDGTTDFTAPTDAVAAKVSVSSKTTAALADDMIIAVHVNGTEVRRYQSSVNQWGDAGCFGLIALVATDVVTIEALGTGKTLDATYTFLSIEWL